MTRTTQPAQILPFIQSWQAFKKHDLQVKFMKFQQVERLDHNKSSKQTERNKRTRSLLFNLPKQIQTVTEFTNTFLFFVFLEIEILNLDVILKKKCEYFYF